MNMTAIGFDIAKGVVQAPGVDACGQVVVRKRLARRRWRFLRLEPCLVGLEACRGAHLGARAPRRFGHEARLIAAPLREA